MMEGILKRVFTLIILCMLLAERPWRRGEVGSLLSEWIMGEAEASGAGWVELRSRGDGWLILEAENPELISSIIKLYAYLPLTVEGPPYTAKITRMDERVVEFAYPSNRGEEVAVAGVDEWAASLGGGGEQFLRAVGIVEGGPVSISLNLPSVAQVALLEEALKRGLDRIMLLDLAPQEVEDLMKDKETRGFIAGHLPLTLLNHILYIKLGSRLERALERIGMRAESLGGSVIPLPWEKLREVGRVGVEPTTSAV